MRRTKIVATLGPATDRPGMISRLVDAGLDAARLNYSHGTATEHAQRARDVRAAAAQCGREIGLIADLQGPKIRLECFRKEAVELTEGARFSIDADCSPEAGTEERVGVNPDKAVAAMSRVCEGAEDAWADPVTSVLLDDEFDRVDQAIAMSAIYCGNRIGVKAIAALTESGASALWMSRMNTAIPIFALSRHPETLRKVTLYRDVYPVQFDVTSIEYSEVTREVLGRLVERGAVQDGDRVLLTKGDLHGHSGGTNAMKIVTVGDFVEHVG